MQRRDFMEYMNNVGAGTSVLSIGVEILVSLNRYKNGTEVPAPMNMRREQQ